MPDSTATPRHTDDERLPYEAPELTRYDDWQIVTGTVPSAGG